MSDPTPVATDLEYVDIDGVPLATAAWSTENLFILWQGPDTRGQDVIIPGAAGTRSKPRRAAVSPRTLFLNIYGDHDCAGTPQADGRIGLQKNLDFLRRLVTDPTGTGDGTRTATLHRPDGTTVSGPVHVEDFQYDGNGPGAVRATLDLTLPLGALA